MFAKLFARNLKIRPFNRCPCNIYARTYASCDKDCKPKGCKMEYPKEKCTKKPCLPKEPTCMRSFSECEPPKADPCKPQKSCCGSDRLTRDPCYQRRSPPAKKDLKLNQNVLPTKSVWEYPADCCGNPCPELLPRFDTLYYRMSDKNTREYQQTWVECPRLKVQKRKICCYDPDELPPICRRAKGKCPETACEYDTVKMKALCCLNQTKKCPKVRMPCCRIARAPPLCKNPRSPTDCQKRCCPYPAFSECCRPCPPAKRTRECDCLKRRTKCEMYAYLRRKLMYGLPPPLPEWPPKMIGPRY